MRAAQLRKGVTPALQTCGARVSKRRARAPSLARVLVSRPLHVLLACLAAGIGLSAGPGWAAPALLATAGLGFAARGAPALGIAAAVALFTGAMVGEARLRAIESAGAALPPGARVAAVAEVLERPRPTRHGAQAVVRLRAGPGAGSRWWVRVPAWLQWSRGATVGARVRITGRTRAPPGRFAAYLRARGIAGELEVSSVRPEGARRGGLAGVLDGVRRRAEAGVAAGLPPAQAALARGLVLGQDHALAPAVREDFRAAGLGHLLAASGQNVLLLIALALPVAAALGLGPRARALALIALVALYVPLAGAGPSVQRAGIMAVAALAALLAGRPESRAWAYLLALAGTLALNPRVWGDPGWQLSFAAVAGIMVAAPRLRAGLAGDWRADWRGRVRAACAGGVALTLAAGAATAPLVAHHFGRLPLLGVAANLLALPALAPVMWVGTLQAALAQSRLGMPLARLLGAVSRVPLEWLGQVAERIGATPGAELAVRLDSPLSVALAYVAIGALAWPLARAWRWLEPRRQEWPGAWRRLPAGRRRLAAAAVAAGVTLLLLRATAGAGAPDSLRVAFIDVGQGDATLVQAPGGAAVLFDGGPPEAGVARALRRLGVRRLAAVVATHQSRDHHGGLAEVIERFRVDLLVEGGDGTRDPAFLALLATARRRGVPTVPARAGLRLRAGPLRVRFLHPPPRADGPPPDDPNARAAVALVSFEDFSLFLSADAESQALSDVALEDVDAMKVPHHGSADPGLPQLLARLRPELAAIEVGRGNLYGHPAPSTLAALEAAVPHVRRTDRDGTILLTLDGREGRIHSER